METLNDKLILIAEFDGRKFFAYKENSSFDREFDTFAECQLWIIDNDLDGYAPQLHLERGLGKYNTSYDWLMPVWAKFRDLTFEYPKTLEHNDYKDLVCDKITYSPIETAFENLVEAIKWYNIL